MTYVDMAHLLNPSYEFDLNDLVLDLENLRERLGFEKAIFVGHSLGGMIAPAYALKYPAPC